MKIQSTTPNPLFGISNNQLFNKKSIVSESIADIANMQERKDMYIPKNPVEDVSSDNAIYDQNGQLLNNSNKKKVLNEVNEEIDYSKINGVVDKYTTDKEYRKMTEEETRLWNFSMRLECYAIREQTLAMLEVGNALNLSRVDQSIDELYAMYDKKFGTDSSDKVKYFNSLRTQASNVQQMLSSLQKALDAGKTRDDIMEFAPDGSFSKNDFDYIMNVADNYDYQNHKLTDKDAIKTNNSNVSSDLSNMLGGMFS